MNTDITFVTGLFDIGRHSLKGGFERDFSHYIQNFVRLLKGLNDKNLVVYIQPEHEHIVWEHRSRENTRTIVKDLNYLKDFPFFDQVQKIRTSKKWRAQSGWITDSPQSALELYNPLVMSKQFMLNDVTLFNFFDTQYFAWVDAGIYNTVNIGEYLSEEGMLDKLICNMEKMLYICFPYDGTVEVHGFSKPAFDRYAGSGVPTNRVARGGFFGGTKDCINQINSIYYNLLSETLGAGFMGTEENIFTLITYTQPSLCNIKMIESNGLIYSFFEELKRQPHNKPHNGKIALYALTFNLPQQFELWVKSLRDAYPKAYDKYKKYVINNSTDESVTDEYKKLFEEHGFEEFKFDNIGINDARHFAAEHFLSTDYGYMVFFEDDMLLHKKGSGPCKNGFVTHFDDILEKAKQIVQTEDLDYLKLSFSEFYGDNHDNWAWYNLPRLSREALFGSKPTHYPEKSTKIDYTRSNSGVPYAVGEFHYCNWPIMFTRRGTKTLFMDSTFEHKYEQTWMSLCMQLQRMGEIKAGCLLASIINHNRVYHYKSGTRRENKHYTN